MQRALVFLAITACGHHSDGGMQNNSDAKSGDGSGDATSPSGNDYDVDGPVPFMVMTEHLMNGSNAFDATVYLPTSPGKHPIVALNCGTQQTAAGYDTYGKRLAS